MRLLDAAQPAYGWVVASVSTVVNSLARSVRSTFALFGVALLGELASRRGQASLADSLSWLCLLLFSPLAGWLHERWGARLTFPSAARRSAPRWRSPAR